jgi:hypothetical protein
MFRRLILAGRAARASRSTTLIIIGDREHYSSQSGVTFTLPS